MRKFTYGVSTFHGIYYGAATTGRSGSGFTFDVRMSTPEDRRTPVAEALERVRDGRANAPDKALLQEIIDALRG